MQTRRQARHARHAERGSSSSSNGGGGAVSYASHRAFAGESSVTRPRSAPAATAVPGGPCCEVNVDELQDQLICPLCAGFFKEPYKSTKCLHSFCKSCLVLAMDAECYSCPVCQTYLGKDLAKFALPDRRMQDLIDKVLFPPLAAQDAQAEREFYRQRGITPKAEHVFELVHQPLLPADWAHQLAEWTSRPHPTTPDPTTPSHHHHKLPPHDTAATTTASSPSTTHASSMGEGSQNSRPRGGDVTAAAPDAQQEEGTIPHTDPDSSPNSRRSRAADSTFDPGTKKARIAPHDHHSSSNSSISHTPDRIHSTFSSMNTSTPHQAPPEDLILLKLCPDASSGDQVLLPPPLVHPYLKTAGRIRMGQLKTYLIRKWGRPLTDRTQVELLCHGTPLGNELSAALIQRTVWKHHHQPKEHPHKEEEEDDPSLLVLTYRWASDRK